MHIATATEPGDHAKASEDWILAERDLIVVLDGATARTDTGCSHGIAWFATKLGTATASFAADASLSLKSVLAEAIRHTAAQHPECDLQHIATPSAAVGIIRHQEEMVEYLVLGDITIVMDAGTDTAVITDDRVDATAVHERTEAARLPFDTPEKSAALLLMKQAELAVRNRPEGFWVAAADPSVAEQSLTGSMPKAQLGRLAVLTDGAARAVVLFGLCDWRGLLDLLETKGPGHLIQLVRAAEASDPTGDRWPRNKARDDASAIVVSYI